MGQDTLQAGADEAVEITEQDIVIEIANYYKPENQQQKGDITVYRVAKLRKKSTTRMVEIIQENPYPGYDLLEVDGTNGKKCWVLRRKTPA